MLRRWSIAVLAAFCWPGLASYSVAQERILGVVPQGAPTALAQQWQPLINHLQQTLGTEIRFATATTITRFEQQVLAGEYDYIYANPLLFMRASKKAGYRALVRRSNPLQGILVTAKQSPGTLADLNGATIAFPSPTALGATILLRNELKRRGIHHSVSYVGNHESGYQGVAVGRYPAAGGVLRTFNLLPEETRAKLTIRLKTPAVSGHVIAAHPRVPAAEFRRLQQSLLTLHRDHASLLENLKVDRFATSKKSDFQSLKKIALPPVRKTSKIAFHVIPRLNQEDTTRQMMPLISYIRQNLELELELRTYKDMTAFDQAIAQERGPSLINANPLQAIALNKLGHKIIAQQTPVSSPKGMHSVILVRKDSPYKSLTDLEGKRIAFGGNRNAFFASVVPRVLLARAGLHGKYIDASSPGSVADVVRRLKSGEIDAAGTGAMAINSEVLKAKYGIDEMPVLASSRPMPGLAWLVSSKIPPDVRDELRDVLVNFGPASPGHEAMTSAGIAGLKSATIDTYAQVREFIREESRLK